MDHLTDAPIANILILAGVIFLAVGVFGRVGGFIGSIFGNIEAGKNSRVLAGVLGLSLIVGGGWLHEESHKPIASNPSPPAPAPSTSAASSTAPAGTASPSVVPAVPRAVPKAKAPAAQPSPMTTRPSAASEASTPAAARDDLPTSSPPAAGDNRLVGIWTNLTPRADSIKRLEVVRSGQGLNVHVWYSCPSGDCDVGFHRLDVSGGTPAYEYNDSNLRRVGSLNNYAPGIVLLTVDLFEPGMLNHRRRNWVFVKSTLSKNVQGAFARYLDAPSEKAFAMAPGGAWSFQFKAASADKARQAALKICEKQGLRSCRIILLNNDATE